MQIVDILMQIASNLKNLLKIEISQVLLCEKKFLNYIIFFLYLMLNQNNNSYSDWKMKKSNLS